MRANWFVSLVALCLIPSLPFLVAGDDPAKEKKLEPAVPKAESQLVAAYRNFIKTKGYKVEMTVTGGISDNPDHTVTNVVVRDAYQGEVYGNTMYVANSGSFPFKAYRQPKSGKGVAKFDSMWKPILAHQQGVRMERLFAFPSNVMDLAVKYAKTAKWVEDSVKNEEVASDDDEEDAEEADDSDKKAEESKKKDGESKKKAGESKKQDGDKRKTTAVTKSDKTKLISMPRVLRVEAPTEEALKHFLQVQNSGCVSGG